MAIAKAYSHPSVELRHVFWGLMYVLGPAAPTEVSLATARSYLDPAGDAYATATVTDAAEAVPATVTDEEAAKAAGIDLATRLAPGRPEGAPGRASGPAGEGATTAPEPGK